MKKIRYVILMLIIMPFINVYAKNLESKDIYYINGYNVEFTKEEYDFISQFYWEGYQDKMTVIDYQDFVDSNIINGEIETINLNPIMSRDTTISEPNKTLKISKSCSTNCAISVVATWKSTPTTKSYDVMGAYLNKTKLITNPITKAYTSSSTNTSSEIKKDTNGFGVSILLPSSGTNYIVNQTYYVSKGGTVYASYQHAKNSISLANSKKYTISSSGYGSVFKFSGTGINVYDQMNGVSITV